jgi:choline dehydrogenase-like flavoprotein
MTRIQLSKPLSKAKAGYEVVVIGSGYGASIAASRLARAGREVAVFERGREIRPGDFPRSMLEIAGDAQVQVAGTGQRLGRADGLLDFHLNDDLSVLIGCGLGGTSLINANVALESDPRLIDYHQWPAIYRNTPALLAPYYDRARKALGSAPYPETAPDLPKLAALKQSAAALGKPFYRPPINVTFETGKNAFGFDQNACNNCGDCCTGCNYGAKNTTLMNYLPDARAHGAQIFTGAEVRHLEKTAKGWNVHMQPMGGGAARVIAAELVVLGAGTMGSTEILLRSRAKGLALSKALGTRFSGNGDVLAFGYNANLNGDTDAGATRPLLRGIGAGSNAPDRPEYQPGPCIAGIIDYRSPDTPLTEGMVIEEGVMPGGLAMGFSAIFFLNEAMTGEPFRFGDTILRLNDAALVGGAITTDPMSLAKFAYDGPVARTQTYLVMSHDSSDGEITLQHDAAVVRWPNAGKDPAILRDNDILSAASDAIWADFQPNPLWQTEMGRKLVSVHPIGGCVMADSAETGVVNGHCQVFDGKGGVHDGLYVCDGAVIPGALGVNPLLTISAVAEFAVETLAKSRGWVIDYTGQRPLPAECHVPDPVKPPPAPAIGDQLQDVIDAMQAAKALIDAGHYDAARAIFKTAYAAVTDQVDSPLAPAWGVLRLMLTDKLMRALGQVFGDFLPLLEAVDAKLDVQDFAGALAVIEDAVGDFTPGLRFDERMAGAIAATGPQFGHPISDPYRIAQRRGDVAGPRAAIVGHFTVSASSMEKLLQDPNHRATLTGTVDCPTLGGRLVLDEGASFDLLRANAAEVECWNMIYCGRLKTGGVFDEKTWHFKGVKTLKRRAGSTWWTDLTTLNVDIWHGPDDSGLPAFQGIMTLGLQDLVQQATTVQTPMAQNIWESGFDIIATLIAAQWQGDLAERLQNQELRAEILREGLMIAARMGHGELLTIVQQNEVMRFGAMFAQLVFRCYGGITAYLNNFPAQDDKIAQHRAMRLPAPQTHIPMVGDKALGLTRYQGGTLGPVILAPGFGVTAASYAMDTTDENLTEFLVARGYDVWLFDYRGSPALDASREPFTIDDLAQHDWPAAVAMVRAVTGAADVQVIAHCFASTSVLMALLAGMKGVRSVISSQTSLHPITSWFNYTKADTHLASLLAHGVPKSMLGLLGQMGLPPDITDMLEHGLKTIDMTSVSDPAAPHYASAKALDAMLWHVPFPGEMPCYNPVCHRVFGIFGASYAHDQLNEATHTALGRVFGEISTEPFLQLAQILRYGRVVDARGGNTYMDKPERIDIPIDFLAGGRNRIFLPETTLRSLRWLRATHPDAPDTMFTRRVFEDYAHMDMFIGKRAHQEVFPYLLDRLQARAKGVDG